MNSVLKKIIWSCHCFLACHREMTRNRSTFDYFTLPAIERSCVKYGKCLAAKACNNRAACQSPVANVPVARRDNMDSILIGVVFRHPSSGNDTRHGSRYFSPALLLFFFYRIVPLFLTCSYCLFFVVLYLIRMPFLIVKTWCYNVLHLCQIVCTATKQLSHHELCNKNSVAANLVVFFRDGVWSLSRWLIHNVYCFSNSCDTSVTHNTVYLWCDSMNVSVIIYMVVFERQHHTT